MKPEDRRLLLRWLDEEAGPVGEPGKKKEGANRSTSLAQRLEELSTHRKDLAPLMDYLRSKETVEAARRALLDREKWHQSLSWRLVSLLFGIGGLGMLGFVLWGGEQAFFGALFFFLGCMTFYLAAQLLLGVRSRRNQIAWRKMLEEFQRHLVKLSDDQKKFS